MAEQQDDKSRLPLAGVLALLAMISSFLIYEGISLKTSRPIDKETASTAFLGKGLVQSRLWQDPYEAVETYRLQEAKRPKEAGSGNAPHTLDNLIKGIGESGRPDLRVVPVFVDGSPYVNGVESRLRDRYAMVSALGAAGYVPESGEYIRVFSWQQEEGAESGTGTDASALLVPVELFIPKAKLRDKEHGKPVLVVWLKDQDFGLLDKLLEHLNKTFSQSVPQIEPVYRVLGPRSSATLSAMLKELQAIQFNLLANPPLRTLEHIKFYSPWATAEDTFLLDHASGPPGSHHGVPEAKRTVDELFKYPRIEFIRTIKTDAVLAEQLLQELKRRQVELKPCPDTDCNPKVALISEWDTLYGRSLPRTFAAVAMNNGSGKTSPALEAEINKLRRDEWPGWIYPHSYLAGLDGELPAKEEDDRKKDGAQSREKAWPGGQLQNAGQNVGQRPEGRAQLDYVIRLAAALKQQEAKSGEKFKAIGVLGSDVYDKLLILQALRHMFPSAIFFTTDLNAGLAYPAQWESARNLIVASHFGLELQPVLQTPIPPFRDSYQTSLFYAALWALDHFVAAGTADCPDCFQLQTDAGSGSGAMKFSGNAAPRLYEIGRHGAFDISTGTDTSISPQSSGYASIHPPRPDLGAYSDTPRNLRWIGITAIAAIVLILAAMLISTTAADICLRLVSNYRFWLGLAAVCMAGYGLAELMGRMMPNAAENEPFALSEGISAWPTAGIRLLAFVTGLIFLWYSWRKLTDNEKNLAHEFNLVEKDTGPVDKGDKGNLDCEPNELSSWSLRRWLGLHYWHPQTAGQIDAAHLWREYTALGNWKNFAARGLPQVTLVLLLAFLLMALLGFPNTPCRGPACFAINDVVIILSVVAMLLLIFYVIDAIRLCRRWVNCIATRRIQWPDGTVTKMIKERGRGIGISEENSDEWLGIELIADRTAVIGNFIYFPFVIMFLLGVARHTYFDNWDFPAALVIVFVVNAILIIASAMVLRRSAEMAKREAIKRLEKKRIELPDESPDQAPDKEKQKRQIEQAIDAIRNNQRGAFLPLTKHPVFGAIALPSGGYGLVLLFEYLTTAF